MVVAQFAEQHVKGDGLRALRRKFLDEPAINLARPVKSKFVTERTAFDGGDAGIFHRDEGEIGRVRRGKMQGRPRAQVVGDAFQPVKEIKMKQPHNAYKHKNEDSQKNRRALERFEFHRIGLNEKPEQLKAALVC